MFFRLFLAIASLAAVLASQARAQALVPVDIELVIAVDTSASVDRREYTLQMEGIAAAFRHPEVVTAIAALGSGGLAVSLIHWSQGYSTQVVVPFKRVTDERSARAFAFLVDIAPRRSRASFTALGAAIQHGARLIRTNDYEGRRKIVDISGDGRNNANPDLHQARLAAVAEGVTVNGLAIETDDQTLGRYYRRNVIGGHNAFVEVAADYEAFAAAMLRKLLREITPPLSLAPGQRERASARSSAVSGMRQPRPRDVSTYSGQAKSSGGS